MQERIIVPASEDPVQSLNQFNSQKSVARYTMLCSDSISVLPTKILNKCVQIYYEKLEYDGIERKG